MRLRNFHKQSSCFSCTEESETKNWAKGLWWPLRISINMGQMETPLPATLAFLLRMIWHFMIGPAYPSPKNHPGEWMVPRLVPTSSLGLLGWVEPERPSPSLGDCAHRNTWGPCREVRGVCP